MGTGRRNRVRGNHHRRLRAIAERPQFPVRRRTPRQTAGEGMKRAVLMLGGALLSLGALAAEPAVSNMMGMSMPADNQHMPTWGTHGMAMFGGKSELYAAHLPMAHPPHDYQAIFTFHVADAKIDAALRQRLAASHTLWTIAPEKF